MLSVSIALNYCVQGSEYFNDGYKIAQIFNLSRKKLCNADNADSLEILERGVRGRAPCLNG